MRSARGLTDFLLAGTTRQPGRLASLDGLRGLAVLFVVLSHMSLSGMSFLPWLDFGGGGRYGVFLFFVLSAFLLTRPLLGLEGDRLVDGVLWRDYALRRVLRILPLYSVVLLVDYVCWSFRLPYVVPISASELVGHLLLQQGKSLYWSVPVEFKYYLVLPLVAVVLGFLLRRALHWALLFAAAALLAASWLWPSRDPWFSELALRPYLPIFLAGAAAAAVQHRIDASSGVRSPRLRAALELAALAAFAGVIAMLPRVASVVAGRELEIQHFHRDHVTFGLLWSALLLAQLNARGVLHRLLASVPMRLVGAVSFSLYLWHPTVILIVKKHPPGSPPVQALVVLVGSLLLAMLSYLAIERPILRLRGARRAAAAT